MNTLKSKIIAFFFITAFLIFSTLAVLILKMEREDRTEDLTALLHHISSEIITEHLDLSNPRADLRYLQGIDYTRTLIADKAISKPIFKIVSDPSRQKIASNRISITSKLSNGYYFTISSDTNFIDKNLKNLMVKLYLLFIVALALLGFIFYLILRTLLEPMEDLVRACDTIDLDKHATSFPIPNASFEIKKLSYALQTLVDKISVLRNKEHEMFKEAAHQIKTPMAILKARLDYYALDETASKEKFLIQANRDISKLLKYLKELLLVQQSQISQDEPLELIDVGDLIAEISTYATPLLQRKEQLIILEDKTTFSISTYRNSLTKLILTILENCINHAPTNSSIDIKFSSSDFRIIFTNIIASDNNPALFNSNFGLKIVRELSSLLSISVIVESKDAIFTLALDCSLLAIKPSI